MTSLHLIDDELENLDNVAMPANLEDLSLSNNPLEKLDFKAMEACKDSLKIFTMSFSIAQELILPQGE